MKCIYKEKTFKTRLSYYNVIARLVDLIGLCWLKHNLVGKYVRSGFVLGLIIMSNLNRVRLS